MSNENETQNKKNSLMEQIGRSIYKAKRAIFISLLDTSNLLGTEEKGTLHMIKKYINLSDGDEKKYAESLYRNVASAIKKIDEKNIRASESLDDAIINFEEIKKRK